VKPVSPYPWAGSCCQVRRGGWGWWLGRPSSHGTRSTRSCCWPPSGSPPAAGTAAAAAAAGGDGGVGGGGGRRGWGGAAAQPAARRRERRAAQHCGPAAAAEQHSSACNLNKRVKLMTIHNTKLPVLYYWLLVQIQIQT
jgi:hypothetical protein